MWLIDRLAEARIKEATQRGALDNLPGAGKPLVLDDDRFVSEELRVACRIMDNAGCLPPEAVRREVSHAQRLLATVNDSAERASIYKRRNYLRMRLGFSRGRQGREVSRTRAAKRAACACDPCGSRT